MAAQNDELEYIHPPPQKHSMSPWDAQRLYSMGQSVLVPVQFHLQRFYGRSGPRISLGGFGLLLHLGLLDLRLG